MGGGGNVSLFFVGQQFLALFDKYIYGNQFSVEQGKRSISLSLSMPPHSIPHLIQNSQV